MLADRIGQLGHGLAGFIEAIGPEIWTKTTIVVVSEFGRTFKQNGDKGTDHGHGSVYWVLGGGTRGGRLAGEQIKLDETGLNDQRDLPVFTDYRVLIGYLVSKRFGVSQSSLGRIFPDIIVRDLGLA